MINLAVINIKDIIKILKIILIIAIMLLVIFKIGSSIFENKENISFESVKNLEIINFSRIIDKTVLISNYFGNNYEKTENGLKKLLVSELAIFSSEEKLMELENQEEVTEFEDLKKGENNINVSKAENNEQAITQDLGEEVPFSLQTNVITSNNKTDKFTNEYNGVKIKNESSYNLTEEMLIPNVDFTNKKDIIIYHTHTCESYTPTEANNYVSSGNFRTTDLNYSVARVGTELTNRLINMGFNVHHDTTYHDYPAYTGSYTRSLSTISGILQNNKDSQFVIDLHRDALGSSSTYGPTVQIGDETVAQIMFVIGTDGGGLEHPNWLNNFKLAVKIQEKANEMYPGLFKPIILRNSRYNQHVTSGACIIEVGATGNTLEQCNGSMKYLSRVIEEVMK